MTEVVRVFSFHAERLEREEVWRRTSDLLEAVELRGGHATLFVHPFTAIEAEADLGPRLRELMERGHELGQHTHFYAPRTSDDEGKLPTLLSAENVRRCLDRDLRYLRDAGAEPRGFVAGGWAIHDEVLRWLRECGFLYDASVRSFALNYEHPDAVEGDGWTGPLVQDGLLRLPTTSPLTRIAKSRGRPLEADGLSYELGYIHDYDLVSFAQRMAAGAALRRWGDAGPLVTASELAGRISNLWAPT